MTPDKTDATLVKITKDMTEEEIDKTIDDALDALFGPDDSETDPQAENKPA